MIVIGYLILLTLAPVGVLGLIRFRPDFKFHWIISTGLMGGFYAVFLLNVLQQENISIFDWGISSFFSVELLFLQDGYSIPMLGALGVLSTAVLLFEANNALRMGWQEWAGILGITGLTGFTLIAGNPLTMMLAWTAVDVFEAVRFIRKARDQNAWSSGVNAISVRMFATLLLLVPVFILPDIGLLFNAENYSPQIAFVLMCAGVLRFWSVTEIGNDKSEARLLFRLAPIMTGAVLLMRITGDTGPFLGSTITEVLQPFIVFTLLLAGLGWISSFASEKGQNFWIIGMGCLSVFGVLLGQTEIILGSIYLLVLGGGLYFFGLGKISRYLMILPLLLMFAVPIFPAFSSFIVLAEENLMISIGIFIGFIMMQGGYLLRVIRNLDRTNPPVMGIKVLYIVGGAVLVWQMFAGWILVKSSIGTITGLQIFIVGLQILLVGLIGYFGMRAGELPPGVSKDISQLIESLLSFRWARRILFRVTRITGGIIDFISRLMEGDGGIIWSLILLVMFLSLLSGALTGGG